MKSLFLSLFLLSISAFSSDMIRNPFNGKEVEPENFKDSMSRYLARYYVTGNLPKSLEIIMERLLRENPRHRKLIVESFVDSLDEEYIGNFFSGKIEKNFDYGLVKKIIEDELGSENEKANDVLETLNEADHYLRTKDASELSYFTKIELAKSANKIEDIKSLLNDFGSETEAILMDQAIRKMVEGRVDQELLAKLSREHTTIIPMICEMVSEQVSNIHADPESGNRAEITKYKKRGDASAVTHTKKAYLENVKKMRKTFDVLASMGLDEYTYCDVEGKLLLEIISNERVFFDEDVNNLFKENEVSARISKAQLGACDNDFIRSALINYGSRAKSFGTIYNFGEVRDSCGVLIEIRPTPIQKNVSLVIKSKSKRTLIEGELESLIDRF